VIPDRIRWAVETLDVEPGDRLLEIGGGPGIAASLVCDRLGRGSLLMIDRSATAIERTRRRNAEHIASGRLALDTVDVADFDPGKARFDPGKARFDPGKARFDKVFAVNVNVFWTTPATEELARIRRALERDGRLFLFYGTPSARRVRMVVGRVVDALRANGFAEPQLVSRSATAVGCIAHLA
jgi:cyclopropane fatty-acyl-phospholipid synthase-like methyltransferase